MERFDVFVIGGGGTGSEVAFQLAQRSDLRVAIAERDKLGGECSHYGCVPTKVMLRSAKIARLARDASRFGLRIPSVEVDLPAIQRRAHEVIDAGSGEGAKPFEDAGISVFLQQARLAGEHRIELEDGTELEADRVVFTTGTETAVPPIPGLADGPYWTNREAIWGPDAPPASLAVIGTGAIGIEFAQIYARFGTAVTAIEVLPQILPHEDEDAAAALVPAFEEEGIRLLPGSTIERAEHDGRGWTISLAGGRTLQTEALLVAAGRRPVFDGHELDAVGMELDDHGRPVLSETLRTTAPNVWAAGDATGELLFTHVGSYEAEIVIDDILGTPRARDYRVVPRVTFCDPEVASVGLTERAARDAGREVRTAIRRLADNERSDIDGSPFGLVKLVADARSGELLGGHIVGEEAGAMIHEVVAAMSGRVPASAIGDAIHAYPTLSESVKGAFLDLAEASVTGPRGILEGMEQTATVITVTDRAAGKIRQLAAKEGRTDPVLRVRVVAGGCSGFSYELSFADAPEGEDHVIPAADGVRVLVDRRSAPIVEGSTLEFNDALLGGGLKMLNPRATHECACGDSFSV